MENCINEFNSVKDIISDLYPIINKDYNKESGFAAIFVFNNLFEECFKLISYLLLHYYKLDYSNKMLYTAYEAKLIPDNNCWNKMLLDRNNMINNYNVNDLEYYFNQIKQEYIFMIEEFIEKTDKIINEMNNK